MKKSSGKIDGTSSTPVSAQSVEMRRLWAHLDYTKFAMDRLRTKELAKIGLTREQATVMDHIQRLTNTGLKATTQALANLSLRRRHSALSILIRMEKLGLVEKIKPPKSREYEFGLTAKGRKLYKNIPFDSIKDVFSALSQDDRQKLSQYVTLLTLRTQRLLGLKNEYPFPL